LSIKNNANNFANAILFVSVQCSSIFISYTPFTRSSNHQANVEQISSQLVEPALSCKRGISLLMALRLKLCLFLSTWDPPFSAIPLHIPMT